MSYCDTDGVQLHPDELAPDRLSLAVARRIAQRVAHDEALPEDERMTIVGLLFAAATDGAGAWVSA